MTEVTELLRGSIATQDSLHFQWLFPQNHAARKSLVFSFWRLFFEAAALSESGLHNRSVFENLSPCIHSFSTKVMS